MKRRLLFLVAFMIAALFGAEKTEEAVELLTELPITAESAAAIRCPQPAFGGAEFRQDADGTPYIAIRFKQSWPRPLDFFLPLELNFTEGNNSGNAKDKLRVETVMRVPDFPGFTAWLEFHDQNGKRGIVKYAKKWPVWGLVTLAPEQADEWRKWKRTVREIDLTPETDSGRLVFHSCGTKQPMEFQIRKIKVYRVVNRNHAVHSQARGNTFAAESGELVIKPLYPESLIDGTITIANERGEIRKRIALVPKTAVYKVTLPERGFYAITVEAKYANGKMIRRESSAAVVGAPLSEEDRMSGRFGIGHLPASLVEWGKAIGFRSTYGSWDLVNIRKMPDGSLEYDSAVPGEVMTGQASPFIGVENIAQLNRPLPDFMVAPEGKRTRNLNLPRSEAELRQAMKLWAENVSNPPAYIDIYNESNGVLTPAEAAGLYRGLAAAQETNPAIRLCGPNTSEISIPYLKAFRNAGGFEYLDAINLHNYSQAEEPEKSFLFRTEELFEFLREVKLEHLPVFFTEFGWTLPPGDWQKPVDELTRTRYTVRACLLAAASGVEKILPFACRFRITEAGMNYSMVYLDDTPTSAIPALATLIRELAGTGKGRLLKVGNGCFAVVFSRGNESLAVFWTTGKKQKLELPEMPSNIRTMTGAPQEVTKQLILGPDPIYCTFSGTALAQFELLPERVFRPGEMFQTTPTELGAWLKPDYLLQRKNEGFQIRSGAPAGAGALVGILDGKYICQPFQVEDAVAISYDSYTPVNSDQVKLQFTLTRNRKNIQKAYFQLKRVRFDGKPEAFSKTVSFSSGDLQKLEILLSEIQAGERFHAIVSFGHNNEEHSELRFKELPLVIPQLPKAKVEGIPWDKLKIVPLPPFFDRKQKFAARFKICAIPAGIALQITVNDAEHHPELTENLWSHDSVQVAFDMDYTKPFVPNQLHSRLFDGHRVVQYGIAGNASNSVVYCFADHLETVRTGTVPDLAKSCKVSRDHAARQTLYTLFFPWKSLGVAEMPAPGSSIGFALLVNDSGKKIPRRCLAFADGIFLADPRDYGKAVFINFP